MTRLGRFTERLFIASAVWLAWSLVIAAIVLPGASFAQAGAPPAASWLSLAWDVIKAHPDAVLYVVLLVLGLLLGKQVVDEFLASSRTRTVLSLAHIAFHAVRDMVAKGELPAGIGEAAAFLDQLDTLLEAHGHDIATPAEQKGALVTAKALAALAAAPGPLKAPSPA